MSVSGWDQQARRLAPKGLQRVSVEGAPRPDERGGTLFLLTEAFHRPGGIQTHNRTLLQALRRCRPNEPMTALVLNDTPEEVEKPEWRLLRRRGLGRSHWRFALGALAAAWRQQPARIILGHRAFLPLAPLLRPVAPGAQRWLLTYGIEVEPSLSALEWLCLASCSRVFAISPYTSRVFGAAGCWQRIELWPCSLPHDWPMPEPTTPRFEAPYRLLSVSRLAPPERHKGIDDLIQAVARLQTRGLPVLLEIVGDGEDRPRLARLAETEGVGRQVTFLGRVDDAQLRARYARCDVFVLPSGGEGFGIVYLEAMAHARPVVAADAGGAPFVVRPGESGWLVPYGRPELLANCLAERISNPGDSQLLGSRAREFVASEFSFEALCRRTGQLMQVPDERRSPS